MAIITGQRTSENYSDSKPAQKKRATEARKAANKPSKRTAPQKTTKKEAKKKVSVEIANTPFSNEEVEIYNALDAEVERREGRAPTATPVKKAKVGDGKPFEVQGLKKGLYLAYSPESGNYLEFKVK